MNVICICYIGRLIQQLIEYDQSNYTNQFHEATVLSVMYDSHALHFSLIICLYYSPLKCEQKENKPICHGLVSLCNLPLTFVINE